LYLIIRISHLDCDYHLENVEIYRDLILRMKIEPEKFVNRILERQGKKGHDACEIMAEAISAVDPYVSVHSHLHDKQFKGNLEAGSRIFLIGFGKASVPMAKAVIDLFGDKLSFAKVITKDRVFIVEDGYKDLLKIYFGGHPVPSAESIESTRTVLTNFPVLTKKDLVIILISGGGSALFTDPVESVSIDDLQVLTEALLSCGADINEINTLRKHLDRVKGGRLAAFLEPAKCFAFILSDVIGNRIDMIASGPIFPDPTTYSDALEIIQRYGLAGELPKSISNVLSKGINGEISETLKPENFPVKRIRNVIVGSNIQALESARNQAQRLGYQSVIFSNPLTCSTEVAAEEIFSAIQTFKFDERHSGLPLCLIFGGETTVEVTGNGKGGRNQDLAMRLSSRLADSPGVLFIALATDGEDGPTDAAGAVLDSNVFHEGNRKGLDLRSFILDNNAYEYFDQMGGLIRTGATGTNVNDLLFVLIDKQ